MFEQQLLVAYMAFVFFYVIHEMINRISGYFQLEHEFANFIIQESSKGLQFEAIGFFYLNFI